MSGNLYWLASYPKSGNTWMRVLLTNYFRDPDAPAHINDLDGGPIASARTVFDDNIGVEASDLTQREIERLRPAVYESISKSVAQYRIDEPPKPDQLVMPPILKVHDAFTLTEDGVPLLSKLATAGAIYLLRNPLDVVPSFAHHSAKEIDATIANMADDDFGFVSNPKRLHNQLRQRLLSWSGHVQSWTQEPDLRRIVVRYEDMIDDTARELTRVIEFLEIEPEVERIERSVANSAFDKLAAQEAEDPFQERFSGSGNFFRKGVVGDWTTALTAEQVAQVCDDHAAVMHDFGYLPLP